MRSSYDVNPWFEQMSSNSGPKLNNVAPRTVITFDHPSDSDSSITERAALTTISSKNSFLVVVVDDLQMYTTVQLLAHIKAITKLDYNVKVGVFFTCSVTSLDVIENLFRSSWSSGIVNIFAAFHSSVWNAEASSFKAFMHDPFGSFYLTNETETESLRNFFPYKTPNYQQHPLRFVKIHEINKTYSEYQLLDTIRSHFNASMLEVSSGYAEFVKEKQLINGDMMYHEQSMFDCDSLYPYRQTTLLLLVPHAQPYTDFIDYLQHASGTWSSLLAYTIIVVTASSLLLIISRYLQRKRIFLFESVVDVLNLLMNDNAAVRYQNLHRADVFITVPLTFTGLIIVNGILSVFQSYLTSPIYQPQINSIEDLYKSSVPIMANEIGWKGIFVKLLEDMTNYDQWASKVHGMNFDSLAYEGQTFNKSISFFISGEQGSLLLEAQRRLSLKAYHKLGNSTLQRYLLSFRVGPNFAYVESVNDIIHRLNCAGLINKWRNEQNEELMQQILKLNVNRHLQVGKAEDSYEFAIPTVVWSGWIVSGIVFICELIWNKIKS